MTSRVAVAVSRHKIFPRFSCCPLQHYGCRRIASVGVRRISRTGIRRFAAENLADEGEALRCGPAGQRAQLFHSSAAGLRVLGDSSRMRQQLRERHSPIAKKCGGAERTSVGDGREGKLRHDARDPSITADKRFVLPTPFAAPAFAESALLAPS